MSDKEYSYEVDTDGIIHKVDPVKCPFCGSTNTEIGDDYIHCFSCKKEHLF